MADYAKINDVPAANIAKVNNVAKANIANVSASTTPSSGATQWVLVGDDGAVGYAGTDLTSWTTYANDPENENYKAITYGSSGSAPRWVIVWEDDDREIQYSDDVTDPDGWTDVNIDPDLALWDCSYSAGAGVWVAVGTMASGAQKIYRSTDGASWAAVDVSGLSGIDTTVSKGIANDGQNAFCFIQKDRVYKSTDAGASWSLAIDFDDSGWAGIRNIEYTNSTWVIMYQEGGAVYVRTAADSDLTDWSTAQELDQIGGSSQRFACGGGICLFAYGNDFQKATVSGKTCTLGTSGSNALPASGVQNIAAGGNGTFVVVGTGGDVQTSLDNGDNWTLSVDGLDITGGDSNEKLKDVAANVYMPV